MPHPSEHLDPRRELSSDEADQLARRVRGFASAGRLRLMWAMMDGERTVESLSEQVSMEQSAVSHHLRVLRELELVTCRRDGRFVHYRLHDHHLPDLLAALRHHREHVAADPDSFDAPLAQVLAIGLAEARDA